MRQMIRCFAAISLITFGIGAPAIAGLPFLEVPADQLASSDPSIERGHDLLRIVRAATKIAKRSEFESAITYASRIAEAGASSVYGTVAVGSFLAVNLGPAKSQGYGSGIGYKYNSDKQTLEMCMAHSGLRTIELSGKHHRAFEVPLLTRQTDMGNYLAQNAFGTAVRVTRRTTAAIRLLVPVAFTGQPCSAPLDMPASDAAKLLPNATMVMVGQLVPPFAETWKGTTDPTIQRPILEAQTLTDAYFVPSELLLVHKGAIVYRNPAPPKPY